VSDIAVKVNNVSKLYRLGVKDQTYDSFGRTMLDYLKSPLKNYRKYRSLYRFDDVLENKDGTGDSQSSDVIWALSDVSFEVRTGEVVGIVGHNGAGKSTLLKVLSRITPPTQGQVEIRGRVSSLLEVGTGFHPELTGRENVFLNGTILGMRKREIDAKFDEIVEFSGVEKFLDTPVKRYSSGMRVRLAFSVAAHLEPEILIVDEVLAVGDAEFQKKCLNKMQDVGSEGRTVLFVSHNMPAVTRLCERVIMIDGGKVLQDGPTDEVVSAYLHAGSRTKSLREWEDISRAPGDEVVRLCGVRVRDEDGALKEGLDIRKVIGLEMEFEVLREGHQLMPYFTVLNEEGVILFSSIDQCEEWWEKERPKGRFIARAWIPGNLLTDGTYYVRATMRTTDRKKRHFDELDVIAFSVLDSMDGDSARGEWVGRMRGVVRPRLEWETIYEPNIPEIRAADKG
jgi:homopolymeric O-antigen transport system ATP-binding protein